MYEELEAAARACEEAASEFDSDPLDTLVQKGRAAAQSLEPSSSGSWAGYHARCYWGDFEPAQTRFSAEWGIFGGSPYNPATYQAGTRGWKEYSAEAVYAELHRRAEVPDLQELQDAGARMGVAFADNRREIITTLDALIGGQGDPALIEVREKVSALKDHTRASEFIRARAPAQVVSRDRRFAYEGIEAPPHVAFEADIVSVLSYATQLRALAELARTAAGYLRKRSVLESNMPKPEREEPARQPVDEPPWDILVFATFVGGFLAGKFGERGLTEMQRLTLWAVGNVPRPARAFAVLVVIGTALTTAAIAANWVAGLVPPGRGMLGVVVRRPWVRILIVGAILLTAFAQALTQL